MNIAIVGSRNFYNIEKVMVKVFNKYVDEDDLVITGGAIGADTCAENEAKRRGIKVLIIPANWKKYGKSAGYKRNILIVEKADLVIACWNSQHSKGTGHSIKLAKELGIKTIIIKEKIKHYAENTY